MANAEFCIDILNWRVVADGPLSIDSCTHSTLLTDPCADCDLVIDALASAVTAI